jgi:hypothetical protein
MKQGSQRKPDSDKEYFMENTGPRKNYKKKLTKGQLMSVHILASIAGIITMGLCYGWFFAIVQWAMIVSIANVVLISRGQ